jgi:hypothetical protein
MVLTAIAALVALLLAGKLIPGQHGLWFPGGLLTCVTVALGCSSTATRT